MPVRLIVLAAGKGTRMKSAMPKVLHCLAGKPLLAHVLDTAATLSPVSITVVIGHGADQVREAIDHPVQWALQSEQLGTGHAVAQGMQGVADDDTVLITYGDVPLTRGSTYQALLDACNAETIGLLTLMMDDPSGYGRILREGGAVHGVVEQKDASPEQLGINEVNAGVLTIRGRTLRELVGAIGNDNAQGEYYLTDVFGLAVRAGLSIEAVHPADAWEVYGVNSRAQLARLERLHQMNVASALMEQGVTLADPARIDVRGSLVTGIDVEIDVNAVFMGECRLGDNVRVGPNCTIIDSEIADAAVVLPNSVIEGARIAARASVGPFARLRPGAVLAEETRVGNFVEIKNSTLGKGSKVNHLSYVGDADIGSRTNVGAGTITANYDGANKHRTTIGDDASIGSNTVLVAPITVGNGATVGAGSTIGHDVADGTLALTRAEQKQIDGWKRPVKTNHGEN